MQKRPTTKNYTKTQTTKTTHERKMRLCTCIDRFLCMYTYMFQHEYMYVYTYTCVYIYIHMYTNRREIKEFLAVRTHKMFTYTFTYINMYIYIYIYIYVYIYVYRREIVEFFEVCIHDNLFFIGMLERLASRQRTVGTGCRLFFVFNGRENWFVQDFLYM